MTHDLSNKTDGGLLCLQMLLYEDVTFEHEELETFYAAATTMLESWPTYRDFALRLAETYETDMTPARLFDVGPLSGLPDAMQGWLRPLIHESWVTRFGIREQLKSLTEALSAADRAFLSVAELLKEMRRWTESDRARARGRENFEAFWRVKQSVWQILIDLRDVPILSRPTPNTAADPTSNERAPPHPM